MKLIDGKQFPTVWSELFLLFNELTGKVDTEQSISFSLMVDWISEYHLVDFTNDSLSGNALDDLTKRGKVIHAYLGSVKNKIYHMSEIAEMDFSVWCAERKAGFQQSGTKELSEAARDRLILSEEEYQVKKSILIRLKVMHEESKDFIWRIDGMVEHLQAKLKAMRAEQPRPLP